MKTSTVILFVLFCSVFVSAFDFTTKSGKEYKNVGIGKIDRNGVEVILPSKTEIVSLRDVSDGMLKVLSPKRKTRVLELLSQVEALPSKKNSSVSREPEKKENMATEAVAAAAEQQLEGVQRWVRVYHISREPSDEARRFLPLCEAFIQSMRKASSGKEKADAFTAFQKNVKEGNFSGNLSLAPTQGPARSYIQEPKSSERYPYLGPRGAYQYKKSGRLVPSR